jgi:hypothetical protein
MNGRRIGRGISPQMTQMNADEKKIKKGRARIGEGRIQVDLDLSVCIFICEHRRAAVDKTLLRQGAIARTFDASEPGEGSEGGFLRR